MTPYRRLAPTLPTIPFFRVVGLGAVVIHVGLSHPQTRFAHYFLLRWIPGQAIEVVLALRQGRTYLLVTPVGFEPNITDLRGRPPKPLEDGAIKLLSLSRQLGFLGHGLSINFAAPILVLPSLAHMRVNTGMLGEFFKLFSFNLTYLLYHNFLKFSRNGVFCQHSVFSLWNVENSGNGTANRNWLAVIGHPGRNRT